MHDPKSPIWRGPPSPGADGVGEEAPRPAPKLLEVVRGRMMVARYASRTIDAYVSWIRRYVAFHKRRPPREMGAGEVNAFLEHLAVDGNVSASTQNQALAALLFLYGVVLQSPILELDAFTRARRPKRLPVVLTRKEVRAILDCMPADRSLVPRLLYGTGMRLMECLGMRVHQVDFGSLQLTIRGGKGDKDRVTMLPASLAADLERHLTRVQTLHSADLAAGWGAVRLPHALAEKYPNAAREWRWQWVFPQRGRWVSPDRRQQGRHHVDPSVVQRVFRLAVGAAGITKHATIHTLRHSFATHLLEGGQDIRTTMVYTHVLNRGGLGVRSPLDSL